MKYSTPGLIQGGHSVLECTGGTGMYWNEKCTGKCTGKESFSVLEFLCTGKIKKYVGYILECTWILKFCAGLYLNKFYDTTQRAFSDISEWVILKKSSQPRWVFYCIVLLEIKI